MWHRSCRREHSGTPKCVQRFSDVAGRTTPARTWHGGVEETVGWPAVIAGFPMPAERIAFYRKVLDLRDSQVCYGVESLAEAVGPGKSTFERKDFQVLSCDGTLAGARNVVLVEIKRFL